MTGLRVLVVDDERPALDELTYLLGADDRVGEVIACQSATDGLRILREREVDCVFLDIQMPGLTGLELAEVLGRFKQPPPVVFVTAHEQHAVDAFDLHAWFFALDAKCRSDHLVPPLRDGGAWLTGELVKEAQRRGLPLKMATTAAQSLGKQTTRLAAAVASIRGGA